MKTSLVAVASSLVGVACATSSTQRLNLPPLQTVAQVDLPRYLGIWYEIASFPQRFQKGCTATTATYRLRDDGEIDVLNKCNLDTLSGPEKTAQGRARVVDTTTNAKLEVSFFRPFWGDYWVIDLGSEYEYAVVGHPGRDYLWILSRTPQISSTKYDEIVTQIAAMKYDTSRLVKTVQPANETPVTPARN